MVEKTNQHCDVSMDRHGDGCFPPIDVIHSYQSFYYQLHIKEHSSFGQTSRHEVTVAIDFISSDKIRANHQL